MSCSESRTKRGFRAPEALWWISIRAHQGIQVDTDCTHWSQADTIRR